jgi:hypothetical protein
MLISYTNESVNTFKDFILRQMAPNPADIFVIDSIITVDAGSSFRASNQMSFAGSLAVSRTLANASIHATCHEERQYYSALQKPKTKYTIPFRLKLIPGTRIMLMRNIDVSQGLINGSRGTLSDLIRDADGYVLSLMVNFDKIPDREIPINRCLMNRYMQFGRKQFSVFQFPIRLEWAVTAHKSQGQTLSRVVINISEGAFAHGSFYVAISRVKRLEDMIIFGPEEWPADGIRFHVNEFIRETEGELHDRWHNVEETPEDDF